MYPSYARNQPTSRPALYELNLVSAMPTLSAAWQHLQVALADTRNLATEVTQLSAELATARLRHANAVAAMRATIGAQHDGEPDPLYYIRDELSAPQNLSETCEGGGSDQLPPNAPPGSPDSPWRHAAHDVRQW
jgi:hypothetical protein